MHRECLISNQLLKITDLYRKAAQNKLDLYLSKNDEKEMQILLL